jgi:hypothetical protein
LAHSSIRIHEAIVRDNRGYPKHLNLVQGNRTQ